MKKFLLSILFALALVGAMTVQAQVAPHATGIDETTVYLNDIEDHSWSYYSDPILPAQMRSLNPIDIRIMVTAQILSPQQALPMHLPIVTSTAMWRPMPWLSLPLRARTLLCITRPLKTPIPTERATIHTR